MALELWNSRHGPVKYNQWMSAFFTMTRGFRMIDAEAPPDEGQAARQRRIMTMYEEIQTVLHEPDHKVQAVVRDSERPAARQDLGRVAAQDLPSRENEVGAQLAPFVNGPLHEVGSPVSYTHLTLPTKA